MALHTFHELYLALQWVQESVLSIGWVIGPVVGGYGAQLGGFGAPFFITAGLAFVCYPLLLWLTPKGRSPVLAAWACLLSEAPTLTPCHCHRKCSPCTIMWLGHTLKLIRGSQRGC